IANQAVGTTIGSDTITNFENIKAGSGDDTLIGSSAQNIIYGGIGQDFIYGAAGDDKLFGEDGNDTLAGGVGNDSIDGGAGTDTVSYFDANSVIVNLRGTTNGTGNVNYSSTTYTDKLYSIENVIGSAGNDTIQGNDADNILDGAGGVNTVSYDGAVAGVTVDLGITGAQNTLGDGTDTLLNFDNLIGSGNDDILKGNSNSNIIKGGNGSDSIYGIGGANFLYGGLGDDTFIGKVLGSDFIDGESGNDKVNYSTLLSANSITVDLGTTTTFNDENGNSQTVYQITINGGDNDYVKNITTFEGSQGDDNFITTTGTYSFIGGSGDDTFSGSSFTGSSIDGSNHTILADGTQGATNAYTGKGDTVDYSNVVDKIILTLENGSDTTTVKVGGTDSDHTIKNIENIYGSNTAGDTITGNNSNNTILGQAGDDTIDGGNGSNYLDGGTNDAKGDTVSFVSASNSI
ncbi:MAG: calcium-binding protein, partial [Arcobacter sp.]